MTTKKACGFAQAAYLPLQANKRLSKPVGCQRDNRLLDFLKYSDRFMLLKIRLPGPLMPSVRLRGNRALFYLNLKLDDFML
ncbi:MAG: hypothetical protein M1510_11100 [Nitrospirae bacterium]|nr:hypothetical protein [Nitrospirota bacterium]